MTITLSIADPDSDALLKYLDSLPLNFYERVDLLKRAQHWLEVSDPNSHPLVNDQPATRVDIGIAGL